MTDVDGLTDAELRTKLQEYGFPMMPITATTRKVMVKKLKLLMENKNKINAEGRRSLSRYSSEEDSDTDVRAKKNRRATMGAPSSLPISTARVSSKRIAKKNEEEERQPIVEQKKIVTSTSTTRSSKIVKNNLVDEYETGSDSESDLNTRYKNLKSSPVKTNVSSTNFTSRYLSGFSSPSKAVEEEEQPEESSGVGRGTSEGFAPEKYSSESYSSGGFSSPGYSSGVPSGYSSGVTAGFSSGATAGFSSGVTGGYSASGSPSRYRSFNSPAEDKLSQIRSRLSLGGPGSFTNYGGKVAGDEEPAEQHTPFLSNFTRRLSQLSAGKGQRGDGDYKNDIIKEHDLNGAGSYARTFLTRAPRPREFVRGSNDYLSSSQENNRKNSMISFVLIGVVLLFFIVLAVLYLGIHNGGSMIEYTGHKIPYCVKADPNSKPDSNCLRDINVQDAIEVFTVLKPELYKRSVAHRCSDEKIKPYMTESEVIHFIKENYAPKDDSKIQNSLRYFEIMLFSNPNWDISIIQSPTTDGFGETPIETLEEVAKNRATMTTALTILNPNLPWRCSILIKMAAIFNTLIFLVTLTLIFYVGKLAFRYYKHYVDKQKNEVFFMVERIVDILQTNASEGARNFMVINHIRDMILPIADRPKTRRTWDRAVKYINENDSRIRTEVQVVDGETCYVWRWLGPNLGGSPRNKTWQGQAFETQAGSVNSLPCPPTPCLKIRGMVEEGDRNLLTIREAVLSKCAHQCRILHCAVDINARCVYLKCAAKEDAAIAYKNLHGWWYSGHLVTVKYIRLERYMQRHPDSPVMGPPFLKALKPCEDATS